MANLISRSLLKWIDSKVPEDIKNKINIFTKFCNDWGFNDWGYSKDWLRRYMGIGYVLNRYYFRLNMSGLENLPKERFLLIGNHSSQMAYDGMIISTALFNEMEPARFVHAMIGSFFASQPLYSVLMPRLGQISGTAENCIRLLNENRIVLVFPEGENGGGKTLFNRYKLMKFGRGFMEIALETKTPIIPFGFIGGEEMVPSFSRMEPIGRLIGMPYMPLSPTLIFPLPTKCSVYFGEPMIFNDDPMNDAAVNRNVEAVKFSVRTLIDRGLAERKSVFF